MPFVPTIYPALDALRGIGGILGLRVFTVTVRQRVWTGERPGVYGSTKSDYDTLVQNQDASGNLWPVRVRQVSRREAIASGGKYTDRDLKVGPFTPSYGAAYQMAAGGLDDTEANPAPTLSSTEIIWIVASQNGTYGIPTGGVVCELVGEEATALHYLVFLRSTGRQP